MIPDDEGVGNWLVHISTDFIILSDIVGLIVRAYQRSEFL